MEFAILPGLIVHQRQFTEVTFAIVRMDMLSVHERLVAAAVRRKNEINIY